MALTRFFDLHAATQGIARSGGTWGYVCLSPPCLKLGPILEKVEPLAFQACLDRREIVNGHQHPAQSPRRHPTSQPGPLSSCDRAGESLEKYFRGHIVLRSSQYKPLIDFPSSNSGFAVPVP